jgi:multicomponent Na+:H+ antiporter subunit E
LEKHADPTPKKAPHSGNISRFTHRYKFKSTNVVSFLILFALWIVFSGRFDGFHLAMGLIASALVTYWSGDLMFTSSKVQGLFRLWTRLIGYIPWLIYQIFLANFHVLYLTFHPRMLDLIDPHILEFDSRLKSDYSRTTMANSITLTPGTITVSVNILGRFSVHCIDQKSGEALPGNMEKKVAKVFEE